MSNSLLLIEDDLRLGRELGKALRAAGHEVAHAKGMDEAREMLRSQSLDLVILDWMLPDGSGMELLGELRQAGRLLPVMMLTARAETEDRVAGLNAGADDYLPKPFSIDEFLARVRSLLRRVKRTNSHQIAASAHGIELSLVTRSAKLGGKPLDLSPKEFELLAFLVARDGEIVSRTALATEVRRADKRFTSLDNVIDVHMANLRRKLRDQASRDPIETVRGVGYRISRPA